MSVKRAALYIRVSTDEQARHGYSLGEQRADLEEYATRNNYAVVDVYADEGVSARKAMSRRKELQRLLADVGHGLIDVILIKCLDRWFRNIADFYKFKEFLDSHGTDWECTQEEYNTTTTQGRLLLNLKLTIAQNESDQTSDRIKYINDGKRKRHEITTGRVPIGYSIKDRHLVPNDDAPAIQFMFNHIGAGNTKRSVIPLLYDKYGIKTTFRSVGHMLENRTYIGELHGITGFCEPIITKELFDKVQGITSRNPRKARSGRIYLFRGLIRCPVCHYRMTAHLGIECVNPHYRCQHSRDYRDNCDFNGVVNERKLERWLLENIQGLLQDEVMAIETAQKGNGIDYQAKLASIKQKLSRLKDLYIDGLINKDTYKRDYEKLIEREREYTTLNARLKKRLISPVMKSILESTDFPGMYENLSREQRQELWQGIIREITFDYIPNPPKHAKKVFHIKFLL